MTTPIHADHLADALAGALEDLVEAEASCDRQTVAVCRREVERLSVMTAHRHRHHQPHQRDDGPSAA
jgi:hypothetical protein